MKLIDKIRAEVEKKTHGEQGYSSGDAECGYRDCARDILSFLDTLETKEVDLEKIFNDEYSKFSNDIDAMDYAFPIDLPDYKDFAKHFFELGLKKGE